MSKSHQKPTKRTQRSRKRKALAAAFREKFAEVELTSKQVAEQIGVVDATLRTWMTRNRFSRDAAVAIAKIVQWNISPEAMRTDFSIAGNDWSHPSSAHPPVSADIPSCGHLFPLLDAKARRIEKVMKAGAASLPRLYGSLADGDLAVFVTATITPVEMYSSQRDVELLDQIAQSVARGGRFLYLRPADELVSQFREHFDSALPYGQEFETEFATLKSEVRRRLATGDKTMISNVDSHLLQLRCLNDDSSFFTPGFVFGLFQTFTNALNPNRRIVVWLPKSFGGAIYLPHDEIFVTRFVRYILSFLERWFASQGANNPAGIKPFDSVTACRRLLEGKQSGTAAPKS